MAFGSGLAHGVRAQLCFALVAAALPTPALAQRAGENAVTQAQDAFGTSIGSERTGLYTEGDVRGFSPVIAGNARIEGLYFDRQATPTGRLVGGSAIRVGLSAQGYPFTAPTGVVDYRLRSVLREGASVVLVAGPFSGRSAEVDVASQINDHVSAAGGLGWRREELAPGDTQEVTGIAAQLAMRHAHGDLRVFYGRAEWRDNLTMPVVFAAGNEGPAPRRARYFGQDWTAARGYSDAGGAVLAIAVSPRLRLRGGLFQSTYNEDLSFTDLFQNVGADGRGAHTVLAESKWFRSTSGEVRLTYEHRDGDVQHLTHLMLKGRSLDGESGGAAATALGPDDIAAPKTVARPALLLGPRSRQEIHQVTAGVAYELRWPRRGELGFALQRTSYEKRVHTPGRPSTATQAEPWLVSATAAAHLRPDLALYAGYTRGLEDSGSAPASAVNFSETLPAARTWQRDIGIRWNATNQLKVVVGGFEVHKPYFNLDRARRYSRLGDVTNRGVEASITGKIHPSLTVLLGVVASQPRVDAVADGLVIGKRPVGVPERTLRFNLDYRLPDERTSLDVGIAHLGPMPVNVANRVNVEAYTVLDLGMRRRLSPPFGRSATLRIAVQNVADARAWRVFPAGGLQAIEPRRATVSLATDF